ncbi:pentapeptide repeat-containing protein [Streptomyces sp. NPDC004051]
MERTRKITGAALIGLLTLIGVCGYGWLLWKGPWYFDRPHLRQRDLQPADGVVITGFRTMVVALGAGIVTAIGLWYTSRNHRLARDQFTQTQEQFKLAQQQFDHAQEQFKHTQTKDNEQAEIAREGQVTDRYVAAIKLLGSATLSERLGGIYSLERIMKDSRRDAQTVIEVLAAFTRNSSPVSAEDNEASPRSGRIAEDVQAAVTVLARRPENTKTTLIRIAGAKLSGVQLEGADLTKWDMRVADLSRANLHQVQALGAHLEDADLAGASLHRADLEGAYLNKAKLTNTNLWGANMRETTLFQTDLSECLNMNRQQIMESHITHTTTLPREFDLDDEIEQRMREGERVADSRDPYNI